MVAPENAICPIGLGLMKTSAAVCCDAFRTPVLACSLKLQRGGRRGRQSGAV